MKKLVLNTLPVLFSPLAHQSQLLKVSFGFSGKQIYRRIISIMYTLVWVYTCYFPQLLNATIVFLLLLFFAS